MKSIVEMKHIKVWRALIANLLVILLLTTGSGSGFVAAQETSAAQEATGEGTHVSADEEQETRKLAERFIRRMEETNDIAPLVGEMFVPDYAARLRREASEKPLALLSKSAVEQASREELLRYQTAMNNAVYMVSLIFLAYRTAHPSDEEEDWNAAYFKQVLTPDIIELFKNDLILKQLFEEETNEGAAVDKSGAGSVEETDAEPIRNVEQLRAFTSTLEQGITLARKHLDALPLKQTLLERHKGLNEEENRAAEQDLLKPRAWMLTEEFYGYPKGTRIVCLNVLVYHMDLVRVDGKLKVLALYLDMD